MSSGFFGGVENCQDFSPALESPLVKSARKLIRPLGPDFARPCFVKPFTSASRPNRRSVVKHFTRSACEPFHKVWVRARARPLRLLRRLLRLRGYVLEDLSSRARSRRPRAHPQVVVLEGSSSFCCVVCSRCPPFVRLARAPQPCADHKPTRRTQRALAGFC